MFTIEYYELPNGDKPVKIFINGLDLKMRAKAFGRIELLEEHGNTLREPYSKAMGDGIFELRIDFAGDITRIFFFFMIGRKAVLTNDIIKKEEKTPQNALDLAKKYKTDYERKHSNE